MINHCSWHWSCHYKWEQRKTDIISREILVGSLARTRSALTGHSSLRSPRKLYLSNALIIASRAHARNHKHFKLFRNRPPRVADGLIV